VDEVSYRKGHRYLTVVADHDHDGAVVWVGEGKSGATLERFFDQLGPDPTTRLTAASMDLHGAYAKVTGARAPQARVCADPFHVVKLANHALDEVRRAAWNRARRATGIVRRPSGRIRTNPAADLVKHTRWALLKDPAALTDQQQATLDRLRRTRHVLLRAWALKEELRDLYRLPEGRRADAHWTAGSPAPAAAASLRWSRCPRPSAPTASRSWPPSSSACPTANSKVSTARSG
jgi:transposase